MNYIPMYYNQTHNQLLLIYIKKNALINGLETTRGNNITNTTEWGKTVFKEKKKKRINLKKITSTISTLKSMCGSR